MRSESSSFSSSFSSSKTREKSEDEDENEEEEEAKVLCERPAETLSPRFNLGKLQAVGLITHDPSASRRH